jgi:hypothetical protein
MVVPSPQQVSQNTQSVQGSSKGYFWSLCFFFVAQADPHGISQTSLFGIHSLHIYASHEHCKGNAQHNKNHCDRTNCPRLAHDTGALKSPSLPQCERKSTKRQRVTGEIIDEELFFVRTAQKFPSFCCT